MFKHLNPAIYIPMQGPSELGASGKLVNWDRTADLARITKRFARLEGSRNTAGHGLGLSLVSAVAKLHGGRLVLKSTKSGLSATIEIPKRAVSKPHPQAA